VIRGGRRESLYYLLRPELVSNFPKKLSSDAFTKFGRHDSEVHNAEVSEATEMLVKEKIPQFLAW